MPVQEPGTIHTIRVVTRFSTVNGTAISSVHTFEFPITFDAGAALSNALIVKNGANPILIYAPGTWLSAEGIE